MKALFVNACVREGSFPALLKLYLEQICVNGITFCYGEDGRPQRLCACEKLVYITTAGGFLPEDSPLERFSHWTGRLPRRDGQGKHISWKK